MTKTQIVCLVCFGLHAMIMTQRAASTGEALAVTVIVAGAWLAVYLVVRGVQLAFQGLSSAFKRLGRG